MRRVCLVCSAANCTAKHTGSTKASQNRVSCFSRLVGYARLWRLIKCGNWVCTKRQRKRKRERTRTVLWVRMVRVRVQVASEWLWSVVNRRRQRARLRERAQKRAEQQPQQPELLTGTGRDTASQSGRILLSVQLPGRKCWVSESARDECAWVCVRACVCVWKTRVDAGYKGINLIRVINLPELSVPNMKIIMPEL